MFGLKRNDVAGAVRVYLNRRARGALRPEDVEMLIMLQDDPAELVKRLNALPKRKD